MSADAPPLQTSDTPAGAPQSGGQQPAPAQSSGESPGQAPPPAAPRARAWRSRSAWITLLITLVIGLSADLVSKRLAFAHVAPVPVIVKREEALSLPPSQINALVPRHEAVPVVPYLLEFRLVLNPGAVFGIGPGKQTFFVAFTALALAFGVWMFAAWTAGRDRWAHIAIGLVLAGGLGNFFDRLVFGCVRDFLHPLPGVMLPFGLAWPNGDRQAWPYVSNIADALLLIGIGVLLVRVWGKDAASSERRA